MAVDRNPDVMKMVADALRENGEYSAAALKEKAEEIDPDIEELSVRQFNARYPLQAKRQLASEKGAGDGEAGSSDSSESRSEDEDVKEQVFEMIRETLRENPEVSTGELQERAAKIDPGVADLSTRSFHARYPLQVKRPMTSHEEKDTADAQREEELRETLRQTLINFAKDVAGAEDRGEVIDVLTEVDAYVDRVMENA